jgi:hypothetical protein
VALRNAGCSQLPVRQVQNMLIGAITSSVLHARGEWTPETVRMIGYKRQSGYFNILE